jgi:signal transduction histidine kinase
MATPSDSHVLPSASVAATLSLSALSLPSQRLHALAALSGSLTDALDPVEAAELVERKALAALGATSAIVVTLGHFLPVAEGSLTLAQHSTLHVVHAVGLPAEISAALEELPLDAPVPFAAVARSGDPLFLASPDELRRYPDWADAMLVVGACAVAIVPVWANGELRGVLGLAWSSPRVFDADERAFVLTLGVMCAQAIMRAHLKAAELEARHAAEWANQSKTNFVANISHELRTPIGALMGYTDLLLHEIDGPITPTQRDHLARMGASGRHLLGLVNELLSHAQIEAREDIVRPTAVLLMDLVEESLSLVRPLATAKDLTISMAGVSTAFLMYTDAAKVRQILINVLANAVKYTDGGSIALAVYLAQREHVATVRLEVSDTGRGVATENFEHIFAPFWKQDAAVAREEGSTGLGLSVARHLAQLLGGDVSVVTSVPGAGSTFAIWLPVRFADAVPS